MEFLCQKEGCTNKAAKSYICNPKVMFCSPYFLDFHQEFPGKHKSIVISG